MSCHGFSKLTTWTVIITCRSALVPYYLSKRFIIFEKLDGILWIYQIQFSGKSLLLYYTMMSAFWRVNQQLHSLLKHWTRLWLKKMYTTNFSIVFMITEMLNPLSNSFIFFQTTSGRTWTSSTHHWMNSQYVHSCLSVTVTKVDVPPNNK